MTVIYSYNLSITVVLLYHNVIDIADHILCDVFILSSPVIPILSIGLWLSGSPEKGINLN